jgi:hypothetical protein
MKPSKSLSSSAVVSFASGLHALMAFREKVSL